MKKIIFLIIFTCTGLLTACQSYSTISEMQSNSYSSGFLDSNTSKFENDYSSFLKKIWTIKTMDEISPSFCITKIQDDVIEAKWSLNEIVMPDCFVSSFDTKEYGDLVGTIHNGVAECEFTDQSGSKGTVELIFKGNDEITAKIVIKQRKYPYENKFEDGEYTYQPYKFGDFGMPIKINTFPVDMDFWGDVNVVTGYISANHPYAVAYLIDEEDNILYEFKGITNGVEIADISIYDINNDGLKDVRITFDNTELEYLYIQMDDGLFYDSKLDPDSSISHMVTLP